MVVEIVKRVCRVDGLKQENDPDAAS
jgi:hypothetical protein